MYRIVVILFVRGFTAGGHLIELNLSNFKLQLNLFPCITSLFISTSIPLINNNNKRVQNYTCLTQCQVLNRFACTGKFDFQLVLRFSLCHTFV